MEQNTEQLLRDLALQLGTTVEKLYEVLTKQSRVYAFNALVKSIIWIGVLILMVFVCSQTRYVPATDKDLITFESIKFIFCYIATFIVLINVAMDTPDVLSDIYEAYTNPENYAVDRFLQMLR